MRESTPNIPARFLGRSDFPESCLDLQAAVATGKDPFDPKFDENNDGRVDFDDRDIWLSQLKNTWVIT